MSHLTAQDRTAIQAALDTQRRHLLDQLRNELEASGQANILERLTKEPGDRTDEASAATEADVSAVRAQHELSALRALNAAASRLNGDDFGLCEDCGIDIPAARLIANPAATRCIACQEKFEKTH